MIAWPTDVSGCGEAPRIGMVDTDLNAEHDALKQARVTIRKIDSGDMAASEKLHGTAVAALLVGQQDSRAPGLVPHAELIAVDAFYKIRSDERADAFALIEALDYLVAEQVDIVNMSLSGPANEALADQIRHMAAQDMVMVAAAGNGGPKSKPSYPAAYDDVIAVTAVDRDSRVYRRASRGPYIDVAAPGVDVWTAASISGRRGKTGTSYATPFVTAAAALLMQARPELSAGEVREIIQASAQDLGEEGRDEVFGYGLLQPSHPCQ
ncbi:S8 family serine peptidase [Paracoccus albus]|uniref:S8 family serine peptidase n=1 Tax=Paracoccus albus TaxID=3017784 RepID=UPI0022F0D13D|nr:S8 family serine peptidase [Paracoccus albus]WBU62108.1 S8 family serine peptidase [Paracoccus albus]